MFCGECGTQNPDGNAFCKNCGRPLKKVQQASPALAGFTVTPPQPAMNTTAAGVPVQAPGTVPASFQQPAIPQAAQPAAAPVKPPWSRGRKIAIVSIIFAAFALVFAPYIAGIIGVVLGAFAIKDREKLGIIGIAIAVIAMAINFLYIYIV